MDYPTSSKRIALNKLSILHQFSKSPQYLPQCTTAIVFDEVFIKAKATKEGAALVFEETAGTGRNRANQMQIDLPWLVALIKEPLADFCREHVHNNNYDDCPNN